MKTILNIVIILLVAAIVAAGFSLIVNNTSLASGSDEEGHQRPTMSADGEMPTRPEGDHEEGASIGVGLLQVLVTLAKLSGIAALVLLAEKGFSLLSKRTPRATPA